MITIQKRLGQYYTKPKIVNAMLDMIGYRTDEELHTKRMLEPSTGDGAFLSFAISRLIESVKGKMDLEKLNKDEDFLENLLKDSFRAIEVNPQTYEELKIEICEHIQSEGINENIARKLSEHWIVNEDFLSWNLNLEERFDFIIGNPPYIRIENIDPQVLETYRERFETLYDRADIYIAFMEHGLNMLTNKGILSYICTDRFAKNNYGKKIRAHISNSFRVKYFIDLNQTQPFLSDVSAYPCIFGIDRKRGEASMCIYTDSIAEEEIKEIIASVISNKETKIVDSHLKEEWFKNDDPWILDIAVLPILEKLQFLYPSIKQAPLGVQCKVGVATGLNRVFLISNKIVEKFKLEKELLIPIITKDHIKTGKINWDGKYLINTFDENNQAVNINEFPNIKSYLNLHKESLANRAFVRKNKTGLNWFYTQEKVRLKEINIPKLVFPDIASKSRIIIENGKYYPEHSLYYVLPGKWNIETLRILMESPIGLAFVKAYSTKMRGGYSRFQKQSVEKICLPTNLSCEIEAEIHEAYKKDDQSRMNLLLKKVYNLNNREMDLLINYVTN